ncbi:hypothetical protein M2306_002836 [Myroides gitamensis]|uniref:Lipoprotein n=1 Tax=Myroides odoratus TaxID=256 RepID=A0A378U2D9_MYROD|nr:hypothetical protein [Myroides odoratus]MCS4237137.1 hypothetical protein [Myroides odoratus]MDH6602142.1 hypothetical protein [Myroides gitamensis]QQU03294.1 hypothetical protein I6I89_16040 [Myroides odoratus]STZ69445.1 Uncharacterised protein [Myroides odoratus]
MQKFIVSFVGLFLVTLTVISCDNKSLNSSKALSAIESYMETQPIYESTTFTVGDTKLRQKKDAALIERYQQLADEGYLNLADFTAKKRFLSKDSIWQGTIKLTEKAHPYVLEQKGNKIKIKTIEYLVDKDNGFQLDAKGKKSATATVMLKKNPTPFHFLKEDKSPNTEFITKKFKMKYAEETGWRITN